MNLRSAAVALALAGALAQVAIAFIGYALGGFDTAVGLVLLDAIIGAAGGILALRAPIAGVVLLGLAAAGAVFGIFTYTLLEIGVTVLFVMAIAFHWARRSP